MRVRIRLAICVWLRGPRAELLARETLGWTGSATRVSAMRRRQNFFLAPNRVLRGFKEAAKSGEKRERLATGSVLASLPIHTLHKGLSLVLTTLKKSVTASYRTTHQQMKPVALRRLPKTFLVSGRSATSKNAAAESRK